MFGAKISSVPGGCNVACGPSQELRILTPEAIAERGLSEPVETITPILAGIALATHARQGLTPAHDAGGMFVEWVPVQEPANWRLARVD